MNERQQALSQTVIPTGEALTGRAAFLGCGDSLAAARPAEQHGHRVLSAGDVAWSGRAPQGVEHVVALSWSGRTGATVRAARIALESGLNLVAITANAASPLATLASGTLTLGATTVPEEIPALGYAAHSAAVGVLCGENPAPFADLAQQWEQSAPWVSAAVESAGPVPQGITIASTSDAHGAAEFWMLKLIEATGLSVRTTGLEEVGHVDYFIGPQPHLTILMSGEATCQRADQLGAALERNGQRVMQVRLAEVTTLHGADRERLGGLIGADVAAGLAYAWQRPPFRGGAVDMSAAHIQIPGD